jgi:hypothetical protein
MIFIVYNLALFCLFRTTLEALTSNFTTTAKCRQIVDVPLKPVQLVESKKRVATRPKHRAIPA